MAFSFPFFLKNGNKKKLNNQYNGNLPCSSLRDQVYPTLASMVQQKTSPNPSPTSSTSSHSRPTSIISSKPQAPPLVPEEVADNSFYAYLRSHFNTIFTRSTVVCIPHSRSLEGIVLTKDFIETHCYNASPYYRGQYQAANGKVISVEHPLISTVSGFKEQRTIHIMSEEWVYVDNKKIRVYMTQRPLEGEASQHQKSRNTINIPTCRNSKSDFDFLNMFAENAESLMELQSAVQEFVDTYVYIRGFNNYTVEKIQHIYTKAYKTILQRNKLIRDTCRIQAEHDYFLELVENVVMGFLHEKLWIQSLRSILQSQDAYISSICQCYSKDDITLQRYAVSYPISEMPLSCFQQAIACLQQTDTDTDIPSNNHNHNNKSRNINTTSNNDMESLATNDNLHLTGLAFTPLEKIACIKSTLDLISAAVDEFAKEVRNGSSNNDSFVTTDEMIPLLAYVITHARISRIASLAFFIEHFRLSHMERSEHAFALVTLKTAISFLKGDPLSLLDAISTISTISTNSTSSTALSPQLQSLRSRSTSFGSPMTSPTFSTPAYNHYQSGSSNYRPSSYQSTQSSSSMTGSNSHRPSSRLHHRKSQSADLQCLLDAQQQQSSSIDSGRDDEYQDSSGLSNRRSSMTPKFHSAIYSQKSNENRHSLDIPNDWMVPDASKSSPDLFSTIHHHQTQQYPHSPSNHIQHQTSSHHHHHTHQHHHHHSGHHAKPTTPPKHVLGHSQPMISTTLPTISNSTPLPGNSPPTSSAANSQQYYYYRHQQYPGHHSLSPKMKGSDKLPNAMDRNSGDGSGGGINLSRSPTPHSSPKAGHLSTHSSSWYLTSGSEMGYLPYNAVNDANNTLDQSLTAAATSKEPHHLHQSTTRTTTRTTPSRHHTPSQPPTIINIPDRLSFDSIGRRPASICIDTRASSIHRPSSMQSRTDTNQEDMGDFLLGLQQMDGDITGDSGHFRMA